MANGAYRTSELPQTNVMVSTDRVVILYNASGNPSVGNGSPGTRTIPLSKLIDAGFSEVFVDLAAANSFAIGNATSNLFVNSSSIIISNFEGTTFVVNTAGVITANGFGITSIQANNISNLAPVATSGYYNDLSNTPTFAVSAFLDTSNASNINTGSLGVGVTLPPPSYETLTIGNSSVNIAANSTSISIGVSNSTANGVDITNNSIQVGNDTVYTVITANSVQIGNGTVYMNSSVISIGNSTVNVATINSTSISVGNSTVSATLSPIGHTVGNVGSETGAVVITNNYIYVGNSIINTYMNAYAFYAGNVSYYATMTPIQLYTSGPTSQSSIQPSSIQVTNGAIYIGIINSTANGVWVNTTSFTIGNSSVNTVINSTAFAPYQTTAGLSANVATLSANNSSYLGTVAAASYQQTGTALVNNVATMSANNSSYLGGVAAASYPNTAAFTVANVAANGSFNLPGGYHIAFGLATPNSVGGNTVTFANAFTTNAYSIALTTISNATYVTSAWANNITKTGFTVYCGNATVNVGAGVSGVYYMAIGF